MGRVVEGSESCQAQNAALDQGHHTPLGGQIDTKSKGRSGWWVTLEACRLQAACGLTQKSRPGLFGADGGDKFDANMTWKTQGYRDAEVWMMAETDGQRLALLTLGFCRRKGQGWRNRNNGMDEKNHTYWTMKMFSLFHVKHPDYHCRPGLPLSNTF